MTTGPELAIIADDLPWGRLSPVAGDAAFRYIEAATALAVAGQVGAICTAPLGLPVIRISVDHGTAFDIAGTGRADERSLLEALRQAIALAPAETA